VLGERIKPIALARANEPDTDAGVPDDKEFQRLMVSCPTYSERKVIS
jgi:hypothetical protein